MRVEQKIKNFTELYHTLFYFTLSLKNDHSFITFFARPIEWESSITFFCFMKQRNINNWKEQANNKQRVKDQIRREMTEEEKTIICCVEI